MQFSHATHAVDARPGLWRVVAIVASVALGAGLLAPALAATGGGARAQEPDRGVQAPDAVREQAASEERARILVRLDASTRPEGRLSPSAVSSQRARITAAQRAVFQDVAEGERSVTARFDRFPLLGLSVSEEGLDQLERARGVAAIEQDRRHQPTLSGTAPWVGADDAHAAGAEGSGETVAILDTGVDADHPAFADDRVTAEACFSRGEDEDTGTGGDCPNGEAQQTGPGAGAPLPSDTAGFDHGTHVASIAAGVEAGLTDSQGREDGDGIARAAEVMAVQVFHQVDGAGGSEFDHGARAWNSDILLGLEHVAEEAAAGREIAAANMSLGVPTGFPDVCDEMDTSLPVGSFETAAVDLASEGVATVAATGNNGSTEAIEFPACVEGIVSVGASTVPPDAVVAGEHSLGSWPAPDDPPEIAAYSNVDDFVDLIAPGNVVAAVPGGDVEFFFGTSMASPMVAGAWAVLQAATAERAGPAELLNLLQSTAADVPDNRSGGAAEPYDEIRLGAALDAATGRVDGTVTDAESGDPIDGAEVTAVGTDDDTEVSATTAPDGTYELAHLAPQTYTVTADAPDYQEAPPQSVTVEADTTTEADFSLEPIPTGTLVGSITDADDDTPIAGASVSATSPAADESTTTGSDGMYTIADLPVESYTVTAGAGGYQSESQPDVSVMEDQTTTADLALQPEADPIPAPDPDPEPTELTVRVVDGNGDPLEGATVELGQAQQDTTDADGEAAWSNADGDFIPTGTVALSVSADGFQDVDTEIDVEANASNEEEITLTAAQATSLEASVTDEDDAPVEDATVEVDGLSATTDADGQVRWSSADGDELPEGDVEIAVSADGFEDATAAATIAAGEANEVAVTLQGAEDGADDSDGPQVDRADGANRVDTAAEVAVQAFDESADTAILATGGDAADALAAAPLADTIDGPVLLTTGGELEDSVTSALSTLSIDDVVVVGGAAAVPDAVTDALSQAGYSVQRVGGAHRYETAALIKQEISDRQGQVTDAVVAASDPGDPTVGWPDAMGAGAYAATGEPTPILLTATEFLPEATADAVDGAGEVAILGGSAVVSQAVAGELESMADELERLSGAHRYETSREVAEATVAAGADPDQMWVATGRDFPDGLTAGAAAAHHGGVLALVDGQDASRSPSTRDWILDQSPSALNVAGGTAAVSSSVIDALVESS